MGAKLLAVAKIVLLTVVVFLLFALIWWGGPDLRIGESRPLEPMIWRLAFIALLLLLCLSPLVWRMLTWLWRKFTPAPAPSQSVDATDAECLKLLKQIQFQSKLHAQTPGRRWRALMPFFAPDYLIQCGGQECEYLMSSWPHPIDWDSGEGVAGRAIVSHNQSWLIVNPSSLSNWAILLKRRRSVKGLIAIIDSSLWRFSASHSSIIDAIWLSLQTWKLSNNRLLPVWLVLCNQIVDETAFATSRDFPWGFSLPSRTSLLIRNFTRSKNIFSSLLQRQIVNPNLNTRASQDLMLVIDGCERDLSLAESAVTRLSRISAVRGLFWTWARLANKPSPLMSLFQLLEADQQRAFRTFGGQILNHGLLFLFLIVSFYWGMDQSIERSKRHSIAQDMWLKSIRVLQDTQVSLFQSPSDLPTQVASLDGLDALLIDTESQLKEKIPSTLQRFSDSLHESWVSRGLRPRLSIENIARVHKKPLITQDFLYESLAFSKMLDHPAHANFGLMQRVLSDFGISSAQQDSIIHHWSRFSTPATLRIQPEVESWQRSLSEGDTAYSLEDRVWNGIQNEVRPAAARDFGLTQSLGPTAVWFEANSDVPWLFTYEGLQEGFRNSTDNFSEWADEYQWVMHGKDISLTRDDLDALTINLRMRYAKETIAAWRSWLRDLTLPRPRTLEDAVSRAQLFGSDESPITRLILALEHAMPVPNRSAETWSTRLRRRISDDWAKLQYEFHWRRSPHAMAVVNDPSISIGQAFAQLETYFPDDTGKSPARERLQATIQKLTSYWEKMYAAEQMQVKPPPNTELMASVTQAQTFPAPLKGIVLSLASGIEDQTKSGQIQSLSAALAEVPTYRQCKLAQTFPFNAASRSDLSWLEFLEDFAPQGRIAHLNDLYGSNLNAKPSSDQLFLKQASAISKMWFPKQTPVLRFSMRSVSLGPKIRWVKLRMGDSLWTFAHGQEVEQAVTWPPENLPPTIELEVVSVSNEVLTTKFHGPWALLRLAQQATQQPLDAPEKSLLDFSFPWGQFELLLTFKDSSSPLNGKLWESMCSAQ